MEILWKGTVSAWFRANSLKLWESCAFPQSFHTRKLGEIVVFYAVYLDELIDNVDINELESITNTEISPNAPNNIKPSSYIVNNDSYNKRKTNVNTDKWPAQMHPTFHPTSKNEILDAFESFQNFEKNKKEEKNHVG